MFFEGHDGTRLWYEEYGEGEPLVFVSSAMLFTDMWEYQIPYFVERGYRCIAFDRRGHGRSDRPSGGYDTASTSDDLAALLEHLDLTGATLIGHSLGGAEVACYLARHGSGRVRRAAFVAATLPFMKQTEDNPQGLPETAFEQSMELLRNDRPRWMAHQAQVFFATHLGNDVHPLLIDFTIQQVMTCAPYATLQVQQAVFHTDHRAGLREIDIPTLVVHGAADFSAPIDVTGRRTAELIPGADYKEYPDAGHGLYASHHARLNADLLEFLKS
ncbi:MULTISPECIES: alpha/beta fold hydrolase [Streptomyces]|uniref:Arylesterase n=2 Tax=Streptomyces TaxID=1883 RepID=A0A2N8P6U1_STRNR|nr:MULTISPECIES: alpha/beta hydrolase [Streptomyces]PNE36745.1 arylesterase [Streptomyces noursei]SHK96954.1 Pimeloyl-ACP methyl ester carboxylesterase [Streptomyces yunnanensis]